MTIAFSLRAEVPADTPVLGVPIFSGRRVVPNAGAELDTAFLEERGFEGKLGEACAVPADDGGTVVAVGLGDPDRLDADAVRRAAAALVRAAWRDRTAATTLLAAVTSNGHVDRAAAAQALVEGAALGAYQFTKYKTEAKPSQLESLAIVGRGAALERAVERGERVATAVALARDLVNEPAGALPPRALAEIATDVAKRAGLAITVWDEKRIAREGLGGLAGVAKGSEEPPRLIQLVYDPPGGRGTLALVGKGITFDSGGLSLKTAEGMEQMKTDMSGAAAVLAAMSVLPAIGPKVKVIGFLPVTENMPSGTATKPGDVLRFRNGKTAEVVNTDAEGRLVLADGLSLAVEAGADAIVDLATLTGACMVALGGEIAGLMGNDDGWMAEVRDAADRAGESVWPLPLPDSYKKLIESEIADVRNTGKGRYGGAITAGLFLQEFVGDVPWAHLDIAGPARSEHDDGYRPRGGTGFGVRTLVELVTHFKKPAARR